MYRDRQWKLVNYHHKGICELYDLDKDPWEFQDLSTDPNYPKCSDKIPVNGGSKKERMVYSGKRKLLGIATMHKSNMVPVFDKEDAKDIAKMRR